MIFRALRQSLTAPMIVALMALLVALAGTGYAAGVLPRNSVGTEQLKPGAVQGTDLGINSISSYKIRNGQVQQADLGPNSVTTEKLKKGAVGPSDLAPELSVGQPVLGKGQSMSGFYGAAGGAVGDYAYATITFPRTLSKALTPDQVVFVSGGASAVCPGAGRAAAGYLCFYPNQGHGLDFYGSYGDASHGGADKHGTAVLFTVSGTHPFTDGTWTVTAP